MFMLPPSENGYWVNVNVQPYLPDIRKHVTVINWTSPVSKGKTVTTRPSWPFISDIKPT